MLTPPWLPVGFSFLSGYPTVTRKRRILVPMQIIADDSGAKGQGPHVVIAGLIGRAEWWAEFSDEWAACLNQAPHVACFKMHQAAHRSGQFAGMTNKQRDEKLIALLRVLNSHPFVALHVTVNTASHAEMFPHPSTWPPAEDGSMTPRQRKQFRRLEAIPSNPYFYAYHTIISQTCYYLWEEGEREQFEFIIDEHPSLGALTKSWYPVARALVEQPHRSIMPVDPITKNDEQFMPLQAADMIAWLQHASNSGKGAGFAWMNKHLTAVKAATRCLYLGDKWFASLRERTAVAKAKGPPPIEAMIELARLQGAPISREEKKP